MKENLNRVPKRLPDIETKRLYLRQRTVDDAEDVFAYASLPEVCYSAGFPPVETVQDERSYLENIYPKQLLEENLPSGYGITLKGHHRVIGSVDFPHRHADDVLEIGYTLHPDYWGQGIVPEAAEALIEIGFTQLGLYKVELVCYDSNKQSQAVARKLGFVQEACIRGRKDIQGNRCSELRYGLLKSDWEKRNLKDPISDSESIHQRRKNIK